MPERRIFRQPISPTQVGQAQAISADTFRSLSKEISSVRGELTSEKARVEGQKAALEDPTREVSPGVTRADREFARAFMDTAKVVTISEGQEALRRIQDDSTENGALNSDSLNRYNDFSQAEIQGILDSTPEQIKPEVELSLRKINAGNAQNVAQKVQAYNKNVLLSGLDSSVNSYNDQATTAYIDGDVREGDTLLTEAIIAVDTAVNYGLITPAEGEKQKKQLDFGRTSSILNGKLRQAESVGRGEEFLNSFFDNRPAGVSDAEHKALSQELIKESRFISSLKGQQQQINYENLSNGISLGIVNSPEEIAEERGMITGSQEAKLQNQLRQRNAKEQSQRASVEQTWGFINNNSLELSNVSDGQISDAYNAMLDVKLAEKQQSALDQGLIEEGEQVQLTMAEKASIATKIPRKVTPIQNEFKFIAASGTPEQKVEASKAYNFITGNNKDIVLDGMNSAARDYFEMTNLVMNTRPSADVGQVISFVDSVINVDQNVRNERKERWKEETNKQTLSDWSTELAGGLGAKTFSINPFSLFRRPDVTRVPEGAADQYRKLVELSFINDGDFEAAKNSAINQMSTSYGPDIVAGTGNLIYLPPQLMIPGYAENPDFAFNSFLLSVNDYANQFNPDDPEFASDIEGRKIKPILFKQDLTFTDIVTGVEQEPSSEFTKSDLLSKRLSSKVQIEIDGIDRDVVYYTDYETANPPVGDPITYGLGYINDDGHIEPLRGTNGGYARWVPDSLDEAERAFRESDEFKEQQKKKRDRIKFATAIAESLLGAVPFIGQGLSREDVPGEPPITSSL